MHNAPINIISPFFVVGAVRSGTTLLRLMLGHHSEVCRCEEMEFIASEYASIQANNMSMVEYKQQLRLDRGFKLSGYKINEKLDFANLANDFLRQRIEMDGKRLVGATVHHDFDQLPLLWPNAKFIFLNRDPRDVSRSCVQLGWAGSNWNGAKFWIDANDAWLRLCESVPNQNRLEINFEELTSQATATMEVVCSFLDLRFESSMLDIGKDTTYSAPDPNTARSWRESAAPNEIAQVESRIGKDRIRHAGYEPSNLPETGHTLATRVYIQASDIWVRVRYRVRKYGLSLWLQGVLARRLPLKGYREKIQLNLDAVDNSLMK